MREAPAATTTRVPVWDLPVRIVHGLLVLLLVALVATGLRGGHWMDWHIRAGETLLTLLVFRILWGFVGSRNARFRSFVRGPAAVRRYARSLWLPPHEAHATHNPLGGWMVLLLLGVMLAQAMLGLGSTDDVSAEGPLSKYLSEELTGALSYLHRRGWGLVVALVVVHIGAVAGYYLRFRENLAGAMLTGWKQLPAGVALDHAIEKAQVVVHGSERRLTVAHDTIGTDFLGRGHGCERGGNGNSQGDGSGDSHACGSFVAGKVRKMLLRQLPAARRCFDSACEHVVRRGDHALTSCAPTTRTALARVSSLTSSAASSPGARCSAAALRSR